MKVVLEDIADMPHTYDHDWSMSVCEGCAREPVVVLDLRTDAPGYLPDHPDALADEEYLAGPFLAEWGLVLVCKGSPETLAAFERTFAERHDLTVTREEGYAFGTFEDA